MQPIRRNMTIPLIITINKSPGHFEAASLSGSCWLPILLHWAQVHRSVSNCLRSRSCKSLIKCHQKIHLGLLTSLCCMFPIAPTSLPTVFKIICSFWSIKVHGGLLLQLLTLQPVQLGLRLYLRYLWNILIHSLAMIEAISITIAVVICGSTITFV